MTGGGGGAKAKPRTMGDRAAAAVAAHRRPVDAEQRLESAEREEQNLVRRGEDGGRHQNHRDAEDHLARSRGGGRIWEGLRGRGSEGGSREEHGGDDEGKTGIPSAP